MLIPANRKFCIIIGLCIITIGFFSCSGPDTPLGPTIVPTADPTPDPTADPTPDGTPGPTPDLTPDPTPLTTRDPAIPKGDSPGDTQLTPATQTITNGQDFTVQIHLNSIGQYFAAYGVTITFNQAVVNVKKTVGNNGVDAGTQGFVTAVNALTPGQIIIAGFDVSGKAPGADLHVCTVHFTAIGVGSSLLTVTISNLSDINTVILGIPTPFSGDVTVQ